MTSLARGLEVMHAFDGARGGRTMSEISTMTGLSRAVVRRCLYTLRELGYVRSQRDVYQLEPKVLSLSHDYLSSASLPAIAQPYIEEVSEQALETCSLATLEGADIVYVARSSQRRIMSVSLTVGSRLPVSCTSLGRVIMAYLKDDERQRLVDTIELVAHTQYTVKTKKAFESILKGVRRDGYAIVSEELEIGLRSLAVPVFGRGGEVVAGMNIGVQATRVSEEQLVSHLPILRQAAERLGSQVN